MYLIYVDYSGTPGIEDETQYYVISGVLINTCNLYYIEIELENFRKKYFVSDYKNEEIHIHGIYKGKGKFERLFKKQKYNILNGLYCTLEHLPFVAISVGIHKEKMNKLYPHWNIFTTAWTFLVERFDMFLCGEGLDQLGMIIIDESDNMQIDETTKILQNLIKYGTKYGTNQRPITRLYNEFCFFPSYSHYGLQLADATSYCILMNLNGYNKFCLYWEVFTKKKHICPNRSSQSTRPNATTTATTPTNRSTYYNKTPWSNTTPKPKMSNSLELLTGPIETIQKKYEILSDLVTESNGKVHGSQRGQDPKTGQLIDLLVYYEVSLGNREEVKQKFAKFFSINVSSISR